MTDPTHTDPVPGGAAFVPGEPPPGPAIAAPQPPVWSAGAAAGLVLIMIVATLLSGAGIAVTRSLDLGEDLTALIGGAALAGSYVTVLVAVWLLARRRHMPLSEAFALRPVPLGTVLGWGVAIAFGGRLIAGLWGGLLQALDVRIPGADIDPTRVLGDGPVAAAMMVLVGVVLAPVVEEVVFRGVLLPALERRWSLRVAVLGSSALFAAIHLSPYSIPPIFGLALLLAYGFVGSRSLWVPIAAHAMFNAIGIGLLYLLRGFGLV